MKIPEYDLNGNIKRLLRRGQKTSSTYGDIDDLTYTYDGNRLKSVTDAVNSTTVEKGFSELVKTSNEYTYDNNGNMITDDNKGITGINYNILNLPSRIDINGGPGKIGDIEYLYDAAGTKLTKTVDDGALPSTHYVGNHIYQGNNLAYILTDEGRIVFNGNNYNFEYNLTDHLGNVRIVLKDDGTVLQKNSYYPFGGLQKALSSNLVSGDNQNRYLFNGKESEPEFGLAAYDFDARFYDKQTGRWFNPDPLEQYDSPYVFGGNNPVLNIDPSGMWAFPASSTGSMIGNGVMGTHNYTVVDGQGKIIDHVDDGDNSIYQVGIGQDYNGSKDGLQKIGVESDNQEYNKGEYVDIYEGLDGNFNRFGPRGHGDAHSWFEAKAILAYSGLGVLRWAYLLGKNALKKKKEPELVQEVKVTDDIIEVTSRVGNEEVRIMADLQINGKTMNLKQLHVEGSAAGKIGRANLWKIIKEIGKRFKVNEVLIQGGKRTTGKYKGKVPTPIKVKVN